MRSGRRRRHRSTMVSRALWLSRRDRKKKSLSFFRRSGSSPWLTMWALRTMALWAAWRKISVRRTVGTTLLRIRSENRFPGPTEGS